MSPDVTQLLGAIEQGNAHATEKLLPLVYAELRRLAAQKLAAERPGQTLEPTALVHEAYLRLVRHGTGEKWPGRGYFFAAAAEAMRRILVEKARRKQRIRHGGKLRRVELADSAGPDADKELLALHDALERLAQEDASAARVVELRHFAGLSHEQVAAVLDITIYQARQKWTYARAWLREALGND